MLYFSSMLESARDFSFHYYIRKEYAIVILGMNLYFFIYNYPY